MKEKIASFMELSHLKTEKLRFCSFSGTFVSAHVVKLPKKLALVIRVQLHTLCYMQKPVVCLY